MHVENQSFKQQLNQKRGIIFKKVWNAKPLYRPSEVLYTSSVNGER